VCGLHKVAHLALSEDVAFPFIEWATLHQEELREAFRRVEAMEAPPKLPPYHEEELAQQVVASRLRGIACFESTLNCGRVLNPKIIPGLVAWLWLLEDEFFLKAFRKLGSC